MAMFSFGKRSDEDEGIPPEPIEGDTTDRTVVHLTDGGNRVRRPLLLAAIIVVLIGGAYLAHTLFFSAPLPPQIASRPMASAPAAPVTTPGGPSKAAAPMPSPPAAAQAKSESPAPTQPQAPPSPANVPEPTKPGLPAKVAPEPASPQKSAAPAKPSPAQAAVPPPAVSGKAASPAAKVETSRAAGPTSKGFSVQLGAMAQQANAVNLKRKLDELGYQAVIRKGSGFVNNHFVTVGDPSGKREAEEMARRLNADGFPSQVVAIDGKYAPQIGSFVNLDEAIDLAREVQKKNYRSKITSKPTATTVLYQVRHGQFDTRAAAMKRGDELKAKGFNAWVVPN